MSGLVFGAVLSPEFLRQAVLDAALAKQLRDANGMPETAIHREYVQALGRAMSAVGSSEFREPVAVQRYPYVQPAVPIREAAPRLGVGDRQVRHMVKAGRFGAKKIGRQWFLSEEAIQDYLAGGD